MYYPAVKSNLITLYHFQVHYRVKISAQKWNNFVFFSCWWSLDSKAYFSFKIPLVRLPLQVPCKWFMPPVYCIPMTLYTVSTQDNWWKVIIESSVRRRADVAKLVLRHHTIMSKSLEIRTLFLNMVGTLPFYPWYIQHCN